MKKIVTGLGVTSAIITIFVFTTGKASLNDILPRSWNIQRSSERLDTGGLMRATGGESTTELKVTPEAPSDKPRISLSNMIGLQPALSPDRSLTIADSYDGFTWDGVFQVANLSSLPVTITDFTVDWSSFSGSKGMERIDKAEYDLVQAEVYETYSDLFDIFSQDDWRKQSDSRVRYREDLPITLGPQEKKYLVFRAHFKIFRGRRQAIFKEDTELFSKVGQILGLKGGAARFDCGLRPVQMVLSTTNGILRAKPITMILVPGCRLNLDAMKNLIKIDREE
jgi:hypothetical protein